MSGTRSFRRSLRASAPSFVHPLVVRDENGMKAFECHVDGYPKPDIRWEKAGKPIGKSRRIHMLRSGEKCLLQIRMPQADDSGLYSCIATNNVGTANTQVRVTISAPQLTTKKLNGTTTHALSPIKTVGLRSRSMERSGESVTDSKHSSQFLRGTRSRSASRDSRQGSSNENTKSRFSNFTNSIWKKNDLQRSQKLEVVTPDKRELSKSMEDCRRTKLSLFNKVKIPEIFVIQKQNSLPNDKTVNHKKTASLVTEKSVNQKKNTIVKVNGNIVHAPLKNGAIKNAQVPKVEINKQKPKNKIASYLKRFESNDTPVKQKEILKERDNSLKQTKNEKNKEHKSSEQVDSDSFFKLGRFIRRKSSGGGKKSPEIVDDTIFVSQVTSDLENYVEISKDNTDKSYSSVNSSHCDISDLSTALETDNGTESQRNHETESTVEVIPDITGFSAVTDIENKNIQCSEGRANENVLFLHQDASSGQCDLKVNGMIHEDNLTEKLEPQKGSKTEFKAAEDENRQAEIFDAENKQIPSICIDEISETEDQLPVDGNYKSSSETEPQVESENILVSSFSDRYHCKGKIRYSSSLIEEECEDLLSSNTQTESLESDLHRVSSPVESPARIVKGPQSVTVLRGESVTLAISFTGSPVPDVLWMKGGRVLRCNEDGRLSILEGREMSVVTVNEVTADDSGKYVVCVENEGGGDSRFASVAVVGFPEPPGGEPTASEVTDHSLVLSWYGSMYDGGSVVTGYQVEMCTLPDKKWHKVTSSINTSCTVQGLSMGQRYLFRVRAENRYGVSHPSKESKMICLNDFLQYDTSSDEEPEEPSNSVTIENGSQFTERFDLKEEVGKGRFGTVYRCVELSSGRARAAKVIRCLKMKDKEKVRQEIEIMSRLHHPKLMQVLAAFESGRNMIMVMEFISGGELFERVIADDFVLTEQDCILFTKQICDGVSYMHKNDILHLDLKPENILCKTRTSHKIKIIDFGLARRYKPDESLRILFGTPEFVAPEVISYEPVSPASDMWSVGVICYVLLSGLSPFMGDNDTETYANITRGEMDFDDEAFDEISQDAKEFISNLLVKKTKGRMSAEECLKHPWLANARLVQKRPLSTEKLKRFIIRRKWQKSGTAIRALGRMVSLSRSSLGSSCDSYSPIGSPTSSRSRASLVSRSETAESGDSVFSR